jgi:hypothetical protein
VAAFGFPQDYREAAAPKTEALRNRASDAYLGAIAGHTVSLAVHPHLASAVFHLVHPRTHEAECIGDSSTDGNLPARVTPGIAIDFFDADARGTSRQEQRPYQEQ